VLAVANLVIRKIKQSFSRHFDSGLVGNYLRFELLKVWHRHPAIGINIRRVRDDITLTLVHHTITLHLCIKCNGCSHVPGIIDTYNIKV